MKHKMVTLSGVILAALLGACGGNGGMSGGGPPPPSNSPFWAQWGANPQHGGMVSVAGQSVTTQLANIHYDPFVAQEEAENVPLYGEAALTVHYQAPLTDGNDVYMMTKTGNYISCNPAGAWANGSACGPNTWNTMIWNVGRFTWINGQFTQIWVSPSDWKPVPNSPNGGPTGSEPVFHPADVNNFIAVPGANGTMWELSKKDGSVLANINPFPGINTNLYVTSPLTVDASGNIYYNVIQLNPNPAGADPWVTNDVAGAWLVKVTSGGVTSTVSYATLLPGAPAGTSQCPGYFFQLNDNGASLPWPPTPTSVAPAKLCGSQRPGLNIAPAVSPDGTVVYTASRAHFDDQVTYMIAVNTSDLSLKWATSLQNILPDGCGSANLPIAPSGDTTEPNSCRFGTTPGVDPTTNAIGSARLQDQASSSPTALPDGVAMGVKEHYNFGRGHLLKFDAAGNFKATFGFGWDSTPAVYMHDGTYSLVIKDNHYGIPAYCSFSNPVCALTPQVYYITQLDAGLNVEWQFQSTNTESCMANPPGPPICISNQPNGFEWCINAPAIDVNGNVYVNSEDGNIYQLSQPPPGTPAGTIITQPAGNLFLNLALGAAYTPLSIGPDGKLYTQNNGQLFVVGK